MDCRALKNHLLPCPYCVIPFLLPLCPSPFPQPISHPSRFIFFTSLLLSLSIFCDAYSLSARALSFLPSFTKDGLSFCFFHYSHIASTHTQKKRTLRIPLSFWLSSSAILAVSSCFSLSVFSKRSINQRLAVFLTYHYLWSCCSYHFHAAVKCAEYSTQPRQEYFITD